VFGRNLQCELVKKGTPERNVIGHTPARFKRAGVGTNGILECKFLSKNAHRAESAKYREDVSEKDEARSFRSFA
jgi:hypothetical protein